MLCQSVDGHLDEHVDVKCIKAIDVKSIMVVVLGGLFEAERKKRHNHNELLPHPDVHPSVTLHVRFIIFIVLRLSVFIVICVHKMAYRHSLAILTADEVSQGGSCLPILSLQKRSPFASDFRPQRNHASWASNNHSEGRKWGVGSVVVESAFLGRPDFQSRRLQTHILKGFDAILGQKSGAPQTQIQRPRIQRPILGLPNHASFQGTVYIAAATARDSRDFGALMIRFLDGQNHQSPIATVQRTQSTLSSHSAIRLGMTLKNECYTDERQSRDSNGSATNTEFLRTYEDHFQCVFGKI